MSHEIKGQMSIFDFIKPNSKIKVFYKFADLSLWKSVHCSECANANISVNNEKFCNYEKCTKNSYANYKQKESDGE